ncbi:MAG: hypothetical protein V4507_05905 [Verrucomicrobiota bacterium]
MMSFVHVSTAVEWLFVCLSLIFIHECGRYWMGRYVGIPASRIRICMWAFPQHVALLGEEGWISPLSHRKFTEELRRHVPSRSKVVLFVGGGLVTGSLFIWVICPLLLFFHYPLWASKFFYLSVQIHIVYFILETSVACLLRRSVGDFSALWVISKKAYFWTLSIVLLCHGAIWFLLHPPKILPS